MLKTQSVAQQDADTKVSDMEARRAMLASAQANVAHLAELVSYEKITAPFDGTITARNVDVGALVTAGGTPGTAGMSGELFHIQQTGELRVFVDVPQDDAPYVTPDTGVYLTAQQYPGRHIAAKVARTTGSIDPSSRTLRVEVDVDNKDGTLMPGRTRRCICSCSRPHRRSICRSAPCSSSRRRDGRRGRRRRPGGAQDGTHRPRFRHACGDHHGPRGDRPRDR
jgi:RND family efflux transporter, MFP subunit